MTVCHLDLLLLLFLYRMAPTTGSCPRPQWARRTFEYPYGGQPLGCDQKYEAQEIIGESELDYRVTAVIEIWLLKVLVSDNLVRKYQAEQRAASWVGRAGLTG